MSDRIDEIAAQTAQKICEYNNCDFNNVKAHVAGAMLQAQAIHAQPAAAEIERLRERCEVYKCQVEAGAQMIEQQRASLGRLRSAVDFAHAEGFQWPSDPMAEFADEQ